MPETTTDPELDPNAQSVDEPAEAQSRDESPLTETQQAALIEQIENEYQIAWELYEPKRAEWLRRLKLYNNQKREKGKVGDPLLFTIFQTVLAALYEDRLAVIFGGREEGDDDTAENLNGMAEYDYNLMEKDVLDYEWDWDTLFFARGFVLENDFDRELMVPAPEVIDPLVMLRDPRAASVNGNMKSSGAARFLGWEIGMTRAEMKEHPAYFNLSRLRRGKATRNLTDDARQARRDAQGLQHSRDKEESLTGNYEYNILRWFTHFKGKKVLVELGNSRHLIVRYQKLKGKKWPIIDRTIFPMAHDWDSVSVPDLIEDKQRARAVMINLGMESAKADLYPMYLFDKKKITNRNDLNFEFNKFVGVNGPVNDAVSPIQKSVFHQQVNLILSILDVAAQKAVAAPELSQGVPSSQDRTLGELEMVSGGVNSRRSLAARIFGWSERRFWQQWYALYKQHFKEGIDEKIVRLQGALAPVWRTFTRENLIAPIDPDITIESTVISEARRRRDYNEFLSFVSLVIQDPETRRRYAFRKLGKLSGLKKDELYLLFPPTIDEMHAEDENRQLENNDLPQVEPLEDDVVHIEIHNKVSDTPAKFAHIEAHKAMMLFKAQHPELFPPPQPIPNFQSVQQPNTTGATASRTEAGTGRRSSQGAGVEDANVVR